MMKLKFKQSIATAEITYNVGQEYDVKNVEQAQSFIQAGLAEEVVEETPSKKTVKENKKVKPEKDGE